MRRRQTLAALCFLGAVGVGFALLLSSFFGGEGSLERLLKGGDPAAVLAGAEGAANGDLDREHWFIQLYGGFQRLTGRRVVEDVVGENTVVKLSTGALTFVKPDAAAERAAANARATADFQRALEAQGVPYRFVLAPQKIRRGEAALPAGVADTGNRTADVFLETLEGEGAAALDLRPLFEETGDYEDWFFRTDHHWRPEAAFFAWQYLTGALDQLATPAALTDEGSWEKTVLDGFFLGSQGKRVGTLYAGTDDFTLFTPGFDTDLTYTCPFYGIDRSGPFETSVCFPERVAQRDWFSGNPYTYYAGGDYPLATIVNHDNPDGPRVLLIRDSFACALTPFLALSCSQLTTVDLRYFTGDLLETVAEQAPDLVLSLYTVGTTGNEAMFQYHKAGA